MTEQEIIQVNESFNKQLQQQIAGTLPAGHVYNLGDPSDILIEAGLPNLPIEMASRRLVNKAMQENHPFDSKHTLPQFTSAYHRMDRRGTM